MASRLHLLARITRWRQSDIARESDAECACGAVADALRNFGDATFFPPQQVFGHGHAPGEQILDRGHAHGAVESLEERRAGEGRLFRQLRNRPGPGRTFVHPSYRDREAFVGKPAHEARRRCRPGRGSECFDEKNLQEASQDDIARGPLRAGFFAHELHKGGQPPLAANMHELRKQRHEQSRVR